MNRKTFKGYLKNSALWLFQPMPVYMREWCRGGMKGIITEHQIMVPYAD